MARKKVKMAFIEDDSARKSTFKKRKNGLLKKAHELATLCDVPICVVINSAYDSIPTLWPSRDAANQVVAQFNTLSEVEKTNKMVNLETFLQQRIVKTNESCRKLSKENKEMEMRNLIFDCRSGKRSVSSIDKSDLQVFGSVLDQYLKDVNRRIEVLKRNGEASSSFVAAADVASTSHVMPMFEMGSSSAGVYDRARDQIKNPLNMNQTNNHLDLNKKQW